MNYSDQKIQRAIMDQQNIFREAVEASNDIKKAEKQMTFDQIKVIAENTKSLPDQVNQLETISTTNVEAIKEIMKVNENLEKQIANAIRDAESAKKDAKFSKITTIVSIVIAAIALITSVVTLLIQ